MFSHKRYFKSTTEYVSIVYSVVISFHFVDSFFSLFFLFRFKEERKREREKEKLYLHAGVFF